MSLFINDALAASAGAAPGMEGAWGSILLLVGFILIFYFLLWRPQSRRAKEHRTLVSNLQKSDEVVTSGGISGKVTQIADDFLELSIAENVNIKVQRNAVVKVLPKGTLKSAFEQKS